MQRVGMTKTDIRKSINSQLLLVFFLPLLFAGQMCIRDSSYSTATSIKFDTPVSGGAYQKLVRCLSCGTTTKTLVLT